MKASTCLRPVVVALRAIVAFFVWALERCWPGASPVGDVEMQQLITDRQRPNSPPPARPRMTLNSSASSLEEVCVDAGGCLEAQPLQPARPPRPPAQLLHAKQDPGGPGYYGVHYQRYALHKYVDLPCALQPFISLPGLGSLLVVARPTMDASAGLAGYERAVPRAELLLSPFVVVVDKPGMALPDDGYYWEEFPLPDVFKLDVSGLSSFEDYVARHLRRRNRRAWRVRQEALAGSPLAFEYGPLRPGQRALVDELWRLYLKNGQRHGFTNTSRRDFYRIHLSGTPGLSLMRVKDTSRGGQIVTFSTGVRSGDCLMSMWCGTDYDNPLSRSCSTYINSQYEFIRIAIEDPGVRWLDFGAQLRQMKTNIGAQGYPVSGYMRCSTKIMQAMVTRMMQDYFDPTKLLEDA